MAFEHPRQRRHPPWGPWRHHHAKWPPPWQGRRGFLFARFATTFGCMGVLVVGGIAALAFFLHRLTGERGQASLFVGLAGLALLLVLLAGGVARWSFRRIASPLADVMAAADAVAEGDLSVRVPPHGHGEFTRLAHSFNRMAAELERADQQRRNLTADVAHELRTPLQIIQGNLEGVLDGVYQPTEEHLEATLEETRLLARLVEDLRTLSLAETGQLPLVWESVDISELLADVGTSFSGQAEAAGVELRLESEADAAPLSVRADADRLDQVLGNLVANALRHTPAGGTITLRAEARPASVRISVCDTGEGIAPEDLPYVFDRFWRGDHSRTRTDGAGSGLGLAIARQLVRAHGGRITVESALGQGTTFVVDLPTEGEGRSP